MLACKCLTPMIIFCFRGIDIEGSTIGIAFVDGMCFRQFSTGVTQDGDGNLPNVISTAAHELGHIFNMDHDEPSMNTLLYIIEAILYITVPLYCGHFQRSAIVAYVLFHGIKALIKASPCGCHWPVSVV